MKKILVLLVFVLAFANLSAQTGKEVVQSCITAMRIDKLDSFKTASVRASLYQQGQKVSIRYFSKDYGEDDAAESKVRLETSSMGKETAIVYADEEVFQVVPKYEELDERALAQLMQISQFLFPTHNLMVLVKDTTDNTVLSLLEGTVKFNDKNCKKVALASSENPEEILQYIFFDEATNWFQGVEIPGSEVVTITCSNFKRAKGYVYPAAVKLLSNNKKILEVEIDKIELDINLEDSLFERKK